MRRTLTGFLVFLSWVVAFSTARPAGVYEDAIGQTGFLFAPHAAALRATTVRTNADLLDASLFFVAVNVPARDRVLLQLEQPFVSVTDPDDIESGFGDLGVRARIRVASGEGRALSALAALRTGSGSKRLFPYSSQSVDFEVALAYVDSLDAIHVWALGGGGLVSRAPDRLDEDVRHDNFARVNAGLAIPVAPGLRVRAGLAGVFYRTGTTRELYFGEVVYRFSPDIDLVGGGHLEAGRREERVSDAAITVAVQVTFR